MKLSKKLMLLFLCLEIFYLYLLLFSLVGSWALHLDSLSYSDYEINVPKREIVASVVSQQGTIREITAYNVGDPYQTDSSPCIGASGDNLCTLVATNNNICASNAFPLGTKLEVDKLGTCIVLDRMNSRYQNRIDWAMTADEKGRALQFGLQHLLVTEIYE